MERAMGIQWRQESPYLHAAYVTTAQGRKVYVGYVATGPGDDAWRGYLGVSFTPVGRGPRLIVQTAIEQRVSAALERTMDTVGEAARDRRSATSPRNERDERDERG